MQVLNQDPFPNTQLKYWLKKKLVVSKASNMCMHVNTLVSLSTRFQNYLNANNSEVIFSGYMENICTHYMGIWKTVVELFLHIYLKCPTQLLQNFKNLLGL